MGFFQSIFQSSNNKEGKKSSHNGTTIPTKPQESQQQQQQQKEEPIINKAETVTTNSTTSSIPKITAISSARISRFQMNNNGTHTHHFTMPPPNCFTGLVEGLLHCDKSFRQLWGERRSSTAVSPDTIAPKLLEERAVVDATLQRKPSNSSLTQKWGNCQEVIGRGACGVVRIAHKLDKSKPGSSERLYAVKEFRKKSSEPTKGYIKRLTSEFCIASSLHNNHVIESLDLLPLNETSSIYCQVMEYCDGGDLFNLIYDCSDTGLEVVEANCLFKQLLYGVNYIHNMGIAHRDLKPENLILTSNGCLKISDFGSAECFRVAWEAPNENGQPIIHKSHGLVGSEPYIAPEEFILDEYDARKVDVWSCGIIYMAMRTGSHLWHVAKQDEDEAYERYIKFRNLVDKERENAKRERNLRLQQLQESHLSDGSLSQQEKEIDVLKARETIKRKAKEGGYDVLEKLDFAAKKVIYRMLDPSSEKRVLTDDIMKNEWFKKIYACH
ncbi:unnamed protein product [Cunninghamella blakesleeana]